MPDTAIAMRTLADLATTTETLQQSSNKHSDEPNEIDVDLRMSEMLLVDTTGFSMDETSILGGSYR